MRGPMTNFISLFLGGLILISALMIPEVPLSMSLPKFQLVDFLLPFTVLIIILERQRLKLHHLYFVLAAFVVYIPITMWVNNRIGATRDYFEVYKFIKFILLFTFFSLIDVREMLQKLIKPVFIVVVVFNILHYLEFPGINELIYNHYNGGLSIEFFGKDSIGNPTSKRIAGFMGNPNTNSIVFLLFAAYFFPFGFDKKKLYWFFSAVFMVFVCQSRTSLLAFALSIIVLIFFQSSKLSVKQWLSLIGISVLLYALSWAVVTESGALHSYSSGMITGKALESTSLTGRYETWRYLFGMIQEKPLFGHGPDKDFFYDNEIYAENEYILYTWRYGILGLLLYGLLYLIPFLETLWKADYRTKTVGLFILSIFLVSALTNNPFTEKNLMLCFAVSLGAFYSNAKFEKVAHD